MGLQEFLDGKKPHEIPALRKPDTTFPSEVIGDDSGLRAIPGAIALPVSGVLPDVYGKNGRLIEEGNLTAKGSDIICTIKREKKVGVLARLRRQIKDGDMHAIYTVTSGIITIFVAAASVELGIRHGKDIKYLIDIVRKAKPRHKK